jgi:hypothetical protein
MFYYIVYIDHDLQHMLLMWVVHSVKSLLEPKKIIEDKYNKNMK